MKNWNKVTPFSRILAAVLFVALPIFGFIMGLVYQRSLFDGYYMIKKEPPETKLEKMFIPAPNEPEEHVIPSPNFSSAWKDYSDKEKGIQFKYPVDFVVKSTNAGLTLASAIPEESLKIEIVTTASPAGDTLDKFIAEDKRLGKTANLKLVIKEAKTKVAGESAVQRVWADANVGETVYVIADNKRYTINKYPNQTKRDSEFSLFLKGIKFVPTTELKIAVPGAK